MAACATTASPMAMLLDRPPLGRMTLQPEQRLHVAVADRLRAWSVEGRLRAVWTSIPHELPLPGRTARIAAMIGVKRKAMGCLPGAADLVLTWAGGAGWIELKRPSGDPRMAVVDGALKLSRVAGGALSPTQRAWREWCTASGVPHAVLRDAGELEPLLVEWGCLACSPQPNLNQDGRRSL